MVILFAIWLNNVSEWNSNKELSENKREISWLGTNCIFLSLCHSTPDPQLLHLSLDISLDF